MSIFNRLNELIFNTSSSSYSSHNKNDKQFIQSLGIKQLFELNRVGVNGRVQMPETDRLSLIDWSRKNELVYACIRKKAEAASDPELIVERLDRGGKWARLDSHPLVALLKKPNPMDTYDTFLSAWIASEELTGDFYAEIVRDRTGKPVNLYPLNPARMRPVPQGAQIVRYQFDSGSGLPSEIDARDVLHRRKPDLLNKFYGLSPTRVAIGAVDADAAQTEFVRSFFHSDGIPSGILKVKNKALSPEEASALQQGWMRKYSRNSATYKQVAVLDEDADFQQIGANLKEVEADIVRMQVESRICMVYGVPPALVGAYVGLKLATNNATMRTHLKDFWDNTMSPYLKSLRVFLTWELLPQFESIEDIKNGLIRVSYDMSTVMALQEDENARHNRARDNFTAGFVTINEAREMTGLEPIAGADYFLQPANVTPISPEMQLQIAESEPAQLAAPAQLPPAANQTTVDGTVIEDGTPSAPPPDPKKNIEPVNNSNQKTAEISSVSQNNSNNDTVEEEKELPVAEAAIGKKGFIEYQGLSLLREPNEMEKRILDLKAMTSESETASEALVKLLTSLKSDLIRQSQEAVRGLDDATSIFSPNLTASAKSYAKIQALLLAAAAAGEQQAQDEYERQNDSHPDGPMADGGEGNESSFLKSAAQILAEITVARIIGEIQKSAVNLFASYSILGKSKSEIADSLMPTDLQSQAMNFIPLASKAAINAAIQKGRRRRMERLGGIGGGNGGTGGDGGGGNGNEKGSWQYLEYSALLDKNCCPQCEEWDGKEAQSFADLPDTPNPSCDGMDKCRCMIIAVWV